MGRRRDPDLDGGIRLYLDDEDRKRRIRRARKQDAEEMRRQAGRHRVTLDLPPKLHEHVKFLAEEHGCSASAMAALLLMGGLEAYVGGNWQPAQFLKEAWWSNRWGSVIDAEMLAGAAASIKLFRS